MIVSDLGRVQRGVRQRLPVTTAGPDGFALRLVFGVAVDEHTAEAAGLAVQVLVDLFVAAVYLQDVLGLNALAA
jgi:hypothetical protein